MDHPGSSSLSEALNHDGAGQLALLNGGVVVVETASRECRRKGKGGRGSRSCALDKAAHIADGVVLVEASDQAGSVVESDLDRDDGSRRVERDRAGGRSCVDRAACSGSGRRRRTRQTLALSAERHRPDFRRSIVLALASREIQSASTVRPGQEEHSVDTVAHKPSCQAIEWKHCLHLPLPFPWEPSPCRCLLGNSDWPGRHTLAAGPRLPQRRSVRYSGSAFYPSLRGPTSSTTNPLR